MVSDKPIQVQQGRRDHLPPPPEGLKKVLVLMSLLVKTTLVMKRLFTLIVLLGIVMGAVLTGCEQKPADTVVPDTNAAPVAPAAPGTN